VDIDPAIKAVLEAFPGAKILRIWNPMDWTPLEIKALLRTSEVAGEHLDMIGKTDLATMTEEEWMTFLEVTVAGFLQAAVPFEK
jgi:hypothetical protein